MAQLWPARRWPSASRKLPDTAEIGGNRLGGRSWRRWPFPRLKCHRRGGSNAEITEGKIAIAIFAFARPQPQPYLCNRSNRIARRQRRAQLWRLLSANSRRNNYALIMKIGAIVQAWPSSL